MYVSDFYRFGNKENQCVLCKQTTEDLEEFTHRHPYPLCDGCLEEVDDRGIHYGIDRYGNRGFPGFFGIMAARDLVVAGLLIKRGELESALLFLRQATERLLLAMPSSQSNYMIDYPDRIEHLMSEYPELSEPLLNTDHHLLLTTFPVDEDEITRESVSASRVALMEVLRIAASMRRK